MAFAAHGANTIRPYHIKIKLYLINDVGVNGIRGAWGEYHSPLPYQNQIVPHQLGKCYMLFCLEFFINFGNSLGKIIRSISP
jgi:hypothetical protein